MLDESARSAGSVEGEKRRDLLKLTITAGAAMLVAGKFKGAHSGDDDDNLPAAPTYPPSPPVQSWMESIPIYKPKIQIPELNPPPQQYANTGQGECGRDPMQRWDEFYPDGDPNHDTYEFHVKEFMHTFNPAYPAQPMWGYDGKFPGPMIHARYNRTVITRIYNELPVDHVGFGSPEISNHLHNMHTPSESDGFPGDYFSATKAGPTLTAPGTYKDHCYPNVCAGYLKSRETDPNGKGDPREALGTLWYHDHTLDSTAANVAKGLVGFYLLFDDIDSGSETDPNPKALRLPSGDYDVPLVFQDKRFDADGRQFFDQFSPEGVLGDQVVVNGKIKPFFRVARRKYRFRLLNGGPSRYYMFYLVHKGLVKRFTYIANDGNLLPYPLFNMSGIRLAMAERADIIVDFSQFALGSEVFLVNRMRQEETRKPKDIEAPGVEVLKFIVDRNAADPSRVLTATTLLRELPPINLNEVVQRRRWEFDREKGVWMVNGKIFDVSRVSAKPKAGTAEIWTLVNGGGGWAHPIHIHMEEGRILSRNGKPPPAHERGRKDIFDLAPGETVEVFIQFRDFPGKYVMHCHNLFHEDHAMMVRFDVEA